jgi:hypothetical protein
MTTAIDTLGGWRVASSLDDVIVSSSLQLRECVRLSSGSRVKISVDTVESAVDFVELSIRINDGRDRIPLAAGLRKTSCHGS